MTILVVCWGQGRAWALLGGERGHYELARGGDALTYLHSMEKFALPTGLLSEQVWDAPDLPEAHLFTGKPTGAAMPLAWAHAEYLKLIRSISDGEVFDCLPEVAARYLGKRRNRQKLQIWSFGYQTQTRRAGERLRVLAAKPFRLRWSADDWQTANDVNSAGTALGVEYADVKAGENQTIRFTFFWIESATWEERDFEIKFEQKDGD